MNSKKLIELRKNTYDLILMDIHMPELDGLETSKFIIEKYEQKRPASIALTAAALEEDKKLYVQIFFLN